MNRKPVKQILAVMLAVSFLWIFAACVLFCGDSVCTDEHSNATHVSATHDAPSPDSCPITETTKMARADRFTFDFQTVKDALLSQHFVSKPKTFYVGLRSEHKAFVFASPPLERLPVIRI